MDSNMKEIEIRTDHLRFEGLPVLTKVFWARAWIGENRRKGSIASTEDATFTDLSTVPIFPGSGTHLDVESTSIIENSLHSSIIRLFLPIFISFPNLAILELPFPLFHIGQGLRLGLG